MKRTPSVLLSFCAIVKNEQNNLPRCLQSVRPYVDELIVVDTGSTDETVNIAHQYGAKVSHFAWCNDFAAARNHAISQASGDWILMLDADEELIVRSDTFRELLTSSTASIAYALTLRNSNQKTGSLGGLFIRLFRNLEGLKYQGRFHETLYWNQQPLTSHFLEKLKDLEILHYGYSDEQILKQKHINRNIPILEEIRQSEGLSTLQLYHLGQMYSEIGQPDNSRECFLELYDRLLPHLENGDQPSDFTGVSNVLSFLGRQSLAENDIDTAKSICLRGLGWSPNFPPLNCLAGDILMTLELFLGALKYFEFCLQLGRDRSFDNVDIFSPDYITTYPAYRMGCAYLKLNRFQDAISAFEMALSFDANYEPAKVALDALQLSTT
jgi:tetratricopeptide (TPR) repeat protein